jgi:hypothetical protein
MKSIVFFITPLIVARAYNLFAGLSEFPSAGMFLHMSRGLLSDLAVGAAVGFVLKPAHSKKPLYYALWTLWVLFFSLNIEHIKVNSANASYSFAHLALTEDFIMGSVLTLSNLSTFIICMALSVGVLALLSRWNFQFLRQKSTRQLIIVLLLVVSIALIPTSRLYPYWAQMNIIEENVRDMLKKPVYRNDVQVDMAVMEKFRKRDLSGGKLVPYPMEKPNILLILIEGLGHEAIKSDSMPYLKTLSNETLFYETFIAQQRQTNRGLYALLCGDLPNFLSAVAKPDIIGQHGPLQACLPEVLRRNGYHTVFMQSAQLGFMRKDLFAESAGFDEIIGNRHYDKFISRNAWGIDDRSLYQNAFMKINQFPGNAPWFMTLLTTGTHHPYNVPGNASPTLEEALLYADNSLKELVSALTINGSMKNTLLLISSDESAFSEGEGMLSELIGNHLPLIVLAPGMPEPAVNRTPFVQADIPLSLLDYLAIDENNYRGRSIFREYDTGRHLIFGNMLTSKIYDYTPDNNLYVCTKTLECTSLQSSDGYIFGSSYAETEADPGHVADLTNFLYANELTFDSLNTNLVFSERDSHSMGGNLLLGDFRFTADSGDKITWRLRLKAFAPIRIRIYAGPYRTGEPKKKRAFIWDNAEVAAGETFDFEREVKVPENTEAIWTNVLVDADRNDKYFVKYLEIERTKGKSIENNP